MFERDAFVSISRNDHVRVLDAFNHFIQLTRHVIMVFGNVSPPFRRYTDGNIMF